MSVCFQLARQYGNQVKCILEKANLKFKLNWTRKTFFRQLQIELFDFADRIVWWNFLLPKCHCHMAET
jgi:hypothetical protein